jgi:hypothetical protein
VPDLAGSTPADQRHGGTVTIDDALTEIDDDPTPAESAKPAKRTPSRRGKSGGRAATPRSRRGSAAAPPAAPANELSGSLAGALRELVNGVEDEVTAITGLSAQIDEHVEALNELRAEATRRLLHLDELRAVAEDVNLSAFLDTTIQPQLPQSEEEFPERIYGG